VFNVRLSKHQAHVILAVTFGNILEWFEIYSYAYLAPVLSRLFFNFDSSLSNLISAFIIFGSGFLTRPFGAVIFGRLGDLIGRKKAFIGSILTMTIPTFLMGCLPTYQTAGMYAPIMLCLLRLFQSIPSAGEAPGTFCFLYENASENNKKFMTSWGAFGNQIGAILGVIQVFLIDQLMSDEFIMTWGWRISFWSGGIIGLFGVYLRGKLQETPTFQKMKFSHKLDRETLLEVIRKHKNKIGIGAAFCAINASTFYLIATYIPAYFNQTLGLGNFGNSIISLTILILLTILLPFFGVLGEKVSNKMLLIWSCILIIVLLIPIYFGVVNGNFFLMVVSGFLYIIPIACMTALLVYRITDLFPPAVRYTGVGLAFNLSDGIIGGFTPAISLILLEYTKNQAGFCLFILLCAVVSLASYLTIKEKT
jgi:Major Facilitator Superfamily.